MVREEDYWTLLRAEALGEISSTGAEAVASDKERPLPNPCLLWGELKGKYPDFSALYLLVSC